MRVNTQGQMTKERCKSMIEKLLFEMKWEEALTWLRRLMDEFHTWGGPLVWQVLPHVSPSVEELLVEDSGSSWNLLGFMYRYGDGGVERDELQSYRCFCKAAEMGHVLALCRKGIALICDVGPVDTDHEAGGAIIVATAYAGCRDACIWVGAAFSNGWGVPADLIKAALWYARGPDLDCARALSHLLNLYPLRCCPFGVWSPADLDLQKLVIPPVATAQKATMMLCKRINIPRHVALLIASYVCTAGEQWPKYRTQWLPHRSTGRKLQH